MPKSCSNKRKYSTEALAIDALLEARIRFSTNSAVTVYQCENCNDWHLTSQGNIHPRLAEALSGGEIKKEQDAYFWQSKLKKY
jgi:hypothetical protein